MEDQSAFQQYATYPSTGIDLDLMKRSMDSSGGPDAKKARWSPNSTYAAGPTGPNGSQNNRDAFANYGYGPNAPQFQSSPQTPLYSTSNLSINTQGNNSGQISPTTFAQQQAQTPVQQASPYNMLGMGMPAMFPYSGQMGQFGAQRLPSLNLNIPTAQGPYSPATLTPGGLAGANINASTGRTVYIGNLPSTASVDELLNLVRFGPLENVRVLPEKSCVFLSFLDGQTAAAFHGDASMKKLTLHNQELKIGWGKPSPVPSSVQQAISQSGASRNVYLGNLEEGTTEEGLRDDLSRFGLIDQVKIVRDKNIGFVHFLSITVATKVVNQLPTEPAWAGKRVNYGKDRCAYVPKNNQQNTNPLAAAQQLAAAQTLLQAQSPAAGNPPASPFSPYGSFSPADAMGLASLGNFSMMAAAAGGLNRTVYLGNIHPETTAEDLCNSIRGGALQNLRYMQDKHIAFVTFLEPTAAFTFYQVASYQGLTLNNRRLKIGWGKNSGPLPPALALAVQGGATRNVYVGNIEDFETFSEDRLKRDFGEFGEIELVNFLKEKNCAFVNYTNIQNAIKAIEGIKAKPEYANLRIAHGKDRCANAPRSGPQGSIKRSASGSNREGISPSPANGDVAHQMTEEEIAAVAAAETEMAVDAPESANGVPAAGAA